jgi:anti-anti-sigma factor
VPHERTDEIESAPAVLDVVALELGSAIRVSLAGDLDLWGRSAVQQTIADALERRPRELVLDFSRLTFTDSTGVQVALDTIDGAAARHVDLTFIPGPPPVQRVFALASTIDHRFVFPWAELPL